MSGTKRKTKLTRKNTVSALKKRKPSLKTQTSSLRKTKGILVKDDSEPLATPIKGVRPSSSIASTSKKTKKSFESSLLAKSPRKKKNIWAGYDDEQLPELNEEQLKSFRPISRKEHNRFKSGKVRRGRPPKSNEEDYRNY